MSFASTVGRLRATLFDARSTSFRAGCSVEEAVRALATRTPQRLNVGSSDQAILGTVSPERVALSRAGALFFGAPVFRGRFARESGDVFLIGEFAIHPSTRFLIGFWLGLIAVSCIASLASGPVIALDEGAPVWKGVVAGIVFSAALLAAGVLGLVILRFSTWWSRGDADLIANHIKSALDSAAT